MDYSNPDIIKEQSHLNIHFKSCEGTYAQAFDKLIEDNVISTRGLKPDAKVFCEFVFDVNTAYFEEMGGYEFARDFFTEAYQMAVAEAGAEQYILSAVMHADERNRALSELLGRDVFHYHLHVVYIPVVEKQILWSKRCKDEHLRGTVKETIMQVSRSKKWAYPQAVDEQGNPILNKDGNPVRIPSYSLLQDRFYEHMREAGFEGFMRGERGSTTKNLSTLEYKIAKDTAKLERIEREVASKEKQLEAVSENLTFEKDVHKTYYELENMGKKKLFGKVELSEADYGDMLSLAKEGIVSRSKIFDLTQKLQSAMTRIFDLQNSWERLYEQTADFRRAMRLAPDRVRQLFTAVFTKDSENRDLMRMSRKRTKNRDEISR